METFHYGDTLIHKEDKSKWLFKRYKIEKVTVSAKWAEENNWQGSQGAKTTLYAVPLDEGEDVAEKELPAQLFTKA